MPQLGAASAGALPRLPCPLPQQQTLDGVLHRQHLSHPVGQGSLRRVEEGVTRARVAGGVGGGVEVVLGLPCFVVFGPLGLRRSPREGVMWSRRGLGDGVAPTVAFHCGAPCSGVQHLCSLWWAAPRRQAAAFDGLSPTPVTLYRTLRQGWTPPLRHERAGECPPPNAPQAHRQCHPPYQTEHAHHFPSRFCLFFGVGRKHDRRYLIAGVSRCRRWRRYRFRFETAVFCAGENDVAPHVGFVSARVLGNMPSPTMDDDGARHPL